jgi:hypothetical protein
MADIFISYAPEDHERAKTLAKALERQGWSVWWDRRILPGVEFAEMIKEAIDEAMCVVVLWSKQSIESEWVKEEATIGKRRKILMLAKIDNVDLPLGFEHIRTADLASWDPAQPSIEFEEFIYAISSILKEPEMTMANEAPEASMPRTRVSSTSFLNPFLFFLSIAIILFVIYQFFTK